MTDGCHLTLDLFQITHWVNFEDVVLDYKVHMVASKMQRICSSWNWTVCWFHGNVWSLGDYYSDYPTVSIGIHYDFWTQPTPCLLCLRPR